MRGRLITGLCLCALLAGGCGGTSLLGTRSSGATAAIAPATPTDAQYLAALSAGQARLAGAERSIPRSARSAAQLARAIALIRSAVGRLAAYLQTIHPPATVRSFHARLIAIERVYAAQLARAEALAARRGGALPAGNLLLASTDRASRDFSATVARIGAQLGR